MEEVKSYINKDLYGQTYDQFCEATNTDFINDDFISELEWAMLITQSKMKQTYFMEGHPHMTINHFDKCHLWGRSNDGLIKDINYLKPIGKYQAGPDIFPYVNTKIMTIGDEYISLTKIKELTGEDKRNLLSGKTYKHIYEHGMAYWDKTKESFYGNIEGYGVNPIFFKLPENKDAQVWKNMIYPICLVPGAFFTETQINAHVMKDVESYRDWLLHVCYQIYMSYQIALTDYYQWMLYIKEYDNIGFIIPIDPIILTEIYKSSLIKFDTRKAMLHFVKEHYRRKRKDPNEDYSIYVKKYLRGETKFNYRGFSAEIIPPKYDINRVKSKKKFVDIY